MKLNSNHQLLFYIELKKKDTKITSFPICLTIKDTSDSTNTDQRSTTSRQREEKNMYRLARYDGTLKFRKGIEQFG